MKFFKLNKLKVFALFPLFLSLSTPLQADRKIDDFDCNPNIFGFCANADNFPYEEGTLAPDTIREKFPNYGLGGESDFYFYAYAENTPDQEGLSTLLNIFGLPQLMLIGLTEIDNAGTTGLSDGGFVNIIYDGADANSPVNNFGLANIDLVEDGIANVFRLWILTSTDADTVDIIIYTDADNFSQVLDFPIPNTLNVYEPMDILFSQFTQGVGAVGSADFSDVTAIELQLNHKQTTGGTPFALTILEVPPILVTGYALGIDQFWTKAQLETEIEASLSNDLNGDGDFDSTVDDGDTVLYTVTLENVEDLQGLQATNVNYTVDFDSSYVDFIPGTVTTHSSKTGLSKGTINLGNGADSSIDIIFPEIIDGEIITITYQVKIEEGWHTTPSVSYSHTPSVVADEWPAYDLETETINFNQFDVELVMTAIAAEDADSDGYSGEGEKVTFNATMTNTGPNNLGDFVFEQLPVDNASLVVGSVSKSAGTIRIGNTAGDDMVRVTKTTLAVGVPMTVTFQLIIDEPFLFEQFDKISVQSLVRKTNFNYLDVSDNDGTGAKEATEMLVDAFPNNIYAAVDTDVDGLPDSWNESECDIELPPEDINSCENLSGLTEDNSPDDTDNDSILNVNDPDDDNDGVIDENDDFQFKCEANTDTDADGMPDQLIFPETCSVQSAEASQLIEDIDDDNDGTDDHEDDFPTNKAADTDTDGDGRPDTWLESCTLTCQSNSGLTLDSDDDNDLVTDLSDDFPLNNAASKDMDEDGFPDFWNTSCNVTCQTNSGLTLDPSLDDFDNDGVKDADDDFPDDCSASVDTDGDGKPDSLHNPLINGCELGVLVVDDDDDADGVLDEEDDFPLNIAASIDEDQDGLPDKWNDGTGGTVNCELTCQNDSGLTLDLFLNDTDNDGINNDPDNDAADDDGDGILNGDEEPGFELIDNNPPIVTPPADRTVLASGEKTTVLLGFASATDYVQGVLVSLSQSNISADNKGPFAVGEYTITWTAVDAAGNVGTATQTIIIEENPDLKDDDKKSGSGGGGSLGLFSIFVFMLFVIRRKLFSNFSF